MMPNDRGNQDAPKADFMKGTKTYMSDLGTTDSVDHVGKVQHNAGHDSHEPYDSPATASHLDEQDKRTSTEDCVTLVAPLLSTDAGVLSAGSTRRGAWGSPEELGTSASKKCKAPPLQAEDFGFGVEAESDWDSPTPSPMTSPHGCAIPKLGPQESRDLEANS